MGQVETVLIKGLMFAVAAFALIKVGKSLFDDFIQKKFTKSGHNDKDFDLLIEEKKQMLRQKSLAQVISGNAPESDSPPQMPELNLYQGREDILAFFSQLKWGEGQLFLQLAEELNELMERQGLATFSCDQFLVSKTISSLLKNGQFSLGKNKKVALTLTQIRTLSMSAVLLSMLAHELHQSTSLGPTLFPLTKYSVAEKKRMILWFFVSKLAPETPLEKIVLGAPQELSVWETRLLDLAPWWRKLLFTSEEIGFYFPHKMMDEIMQKTALVGHLLPRPAPVKESVEWAHQILGTHPQMSGEEIKKAFRGLAQARHPDKFPADLMTPRLSALANENFAQLKRASDLLQELP